MNKQVRIFVPPTNLMQSARGRNKKWALAYEDNAKRGLEPLMGWTRSDSTLNQVEIHFSSQEEAVAFAKKNGWSYVIEPERKRIIKPRNYADNFRYQPPQD